MAQSVECPTLDFGLGLDITVFHGMEPHVGLCTDSVEPAWDSVSSPLSAPLCLHAFSLSLRIKFKKLKYEKALKNPTQYPCPSPPNPTL